MPLRDIFLDRRRPLVALAVIAVVLAAGFAWKPILWLGQIGLAAFALTLVVDLIWLARASVEVSREVPDRLSIGDENPGVWTIQASHDLFVSLVDEWPAQIDPHRGEPEIAIRSGETKRIGFMLRPTERGDLAFGSLHAFARTKIGLLERRFSGSDGFESTVYPAFLAMRRYELMAATQHLDLAGIKRVRRRGASTAFEHVRDYVVGDDIRSVNWKATARRGDLMVNQYQQERAQPIYSLVDVGRTMALPFDGLSLLDHSLNAALVLSAIALRRHDHAGVMTFGKTPQQIAPASARPGQMNVILETLYDAAPSEEDSDVEALYYHVRRTVKRRSLLLVFSNFETRSALRRQRNALVAMARQHVVLCVFFRNPLLRDVGAGLEGLDRVYAQTIASHVAMEKEQMASELRRLGVGTLLTGPQQLSADVLNAYLSLKAAGRI